MVRPAHVVLVLLSLAACSHHHEEGADLSVSPLVDGGAGDGAVGDGGFAVDAGGSDASVAVPCGTEGWLTYGHDSQRTFASTGCVKGPFTTAYRYQPPIPNAQSIAFLLHAVTDGSDVYLSWRGGGGYGIPYANKLSAAGVSAWQYQGNDASFGAWLSLALGVVVFNDDGLAYLDPATGTALHSISYDTWGQTAPGDGRVYVVNADKVDGPGVFVRAYDADFNQLWDDNDLGQTGQFNPTDSVGGIAVDGQVVYFAGNYMGMPTPTLVSGVYAFDGATGAVQWTQATTPVGPPSAGGGRIYLAEQSSGNTVVVARNESDGTVAWTAMPGTGYTGGQPPVLAHGLAIVSTPTAIVALHADTGAMAWSVPFTFNGVFQGFNAPAATYLAAAIGGTGTLVAAGGEYNSPTVAVLDLATGTILSTTPVTMAMGTLVNPIIVGARVYVSDGQALLALDSP